MQSICVICLAPVNPRQLYCSTACEDESERRHVRLSVWLYEMHANIDASIRDSIENPDASDSEDVKDHNE